MTELIILCGTRTEEEIKRVIEYLIQEFPMARNGKLTYRPTTGDDPSYLQSANFLGIIPKGNEYWGQFKTTIEHMQTAAKDFENGWNAAMKHVEATQKLEILKKKEKVMKRYLIIDEKDFGILSRFASTTRTVNNVLSLLGDLEFHNKDNAIEDRIQIGIEELTMLKDIIEHLNNDAKNLRFMECNFATSSIIRDNYVNRTTEQLKAAQDTVVKIGTTQWEKDQTYTPNNGE